MDIGIIGGADGPTSIFLSSDVSLNRLIIIAIIFSITVVGLVLKMKKRNRRS